MTAKKSVTYSERCQQIYASLDASENAITVLRATNKDAMDELNRRYNNNEDIATLVHARSAFIDDLLLAVWRWCGLSQDNGMCLIAVGGYGRGELHPHSDIDLLILIDPLPSHAYKAALEKFVTLLWDIKLDIGHSVRTLEQCVETARKELAVVTNLMESRLLAGDPATHQALCAATAPDSMWDSREFYRAKWDEQIARHRKYADTEYNLEPNLKSSPGGLRDVQTIAWIAKRHFQTSDLEQLVARNFLTRDEFRLLNEGRDFLWLVRWALHNLAGRAEDRLLFEHQRELAKSFGFSDSEEGLAIEKFMQLYYRWALALSGLNDLVGQLYDEAILRACDPETMQSINQRFFVRNNYIDVANSKVFKATPSAVMEIFVLMAQNENIIGPRASTIRLLREASECIGDDFRNDPRNQQAFIQLLCSPHKIATQLQRMNRYGILGKYLPEFGRIIGKMQHDLFHIYTVDAHTIQVVKNMRLFAHDEFADRYSLAASILKRLPKLELLYIAGLYHDIAKGRGGDHSRIGGIDAEAFCTRHGFNSRDTHLVVWLVKNHLLMSSTSQRKDITDPEVIREFAQEMQDQERLDYLYALTVADINATNPKLWNSWRASLLRQLYLETRRALRVSVENYTDKHDWIEDSKENAIRLLEDRGYDADDIIACWDNPEEDYFLRETPTDICWHTEAILTQTDKADPLILIKDTTSRQHEGATQIFVYTPSYPQLFAIMSASFEQLQLSIQDARIFRSASDYSMDTYIVLDADGEPIGNDPSRTNEIKRVLRKAVLEHRSPSNKWDKLVTRQLKHFNYPSEVKISHDDAKTIVELISPDRPGLLARVSRVFLDFDLQLQNARICTLGERVEDVFFVTDQDGNAVTDAAQQEALRVALCASLDQKAELTAAVQVIE
jgi:[protein-PII] uridylyltransferase